MAGSAATRDGAASPTAAGSLASPEPSKQPLAGIVRARRARPATSVFITVYFCKRLTIAPGATGGFVSTQNLTDLPGAAREDAPFEDENAYDYVIAENLRPINSHSRGYAIEPSIAGERQRLTIFAVLWSGQVASIFGSALTGFGIGVWVLQETGSVLRFGLIALVASLPGVLLGPLAGAVVDRWDRRRLLIASDAVAASTTLGLLVLNLTGHLAPWHVYVTAAANSFANLIQMPAFGALTPLLVPKRHFGRAAGVVQTGMAVSTILAPAAAGLLLGKGDLTWILVADLATFGIALATLMAVRVPTPPASAAGSAKRGSLWREAGAGLDYLRRRPGLLTLLAIFAVFNFGVAMVNVLVPPMVLGFAGPQILGGILAAAGVGTLAGGLTMSAWGGPERRVPAILAAFLFATAMLPVIGSRPVPWLITVALFGFMATIPIAQGCSHALWLSQVEPDLQGRVIAIRRAVASISMPLAYLLAGPLADHLFGPWLMPGGRLAPVLGGWFGTGEGRGIGLLLTVVSGLVLATLALAWARPALRRLDDEPDHSSRSTDAGSTAAARRAGHQAAKAAAAASSKAAPR